MHGASAYTPTTCLAAALLPLLLVPVTGQSDGVTSWYHSTVTGDATYYGQYRSAGNCLLDTPNDAPVPRGIRNIAATVALNHDQYYMRACGLCIRVTGEGVGAGGDPVNGTFDVMVNDQCPECKWGDLDFGLNGDGRWKISWRAIPCDLGNSTIQYTFQVVNDWYAKLQARRVRCPVRIMRIEQDGEWYDGSPTTDNHFEFRTPWGKTFHYPMGVEVTSIFNDTVYDWIDGPHTSPFDGTIGVQFACEGAYGAEGGVPLPPPPSQNLQEAPHHPAPPTPPNATAPPSPTDAPSPPHDHLPIHGPSNIVAFYTSPRALYSSHPSAQIHLGNNSHHHDTSSGSSAAGNGGEVDYGAVAAPTTPPPLEEEVPTTPPPTAIAAVVVEEEEEEEGPRPPSVKDWYNHRIEGEATYYGQYRGQGHCLLDTPNAAPVPRGIRNIAATVALNHDQYYMRACGLCIRVTGEGVGIGGNPVVGTFDVLVNDQCPECKWGDLDFGLNGDGRWKISWQAIPCDVGDNTIQYIFQDVNPWYVKLQARRSRCPVRSIRILVGGEWLDGEPTLDNFFEYRLPWDQQVAWPLQIEVASIFEDVVYDEIAAFANIPVDSLSEVQFNCGAAYDYPAPPINTTLPTIEWRERRRTSWEQEDEEEELPRRYLRRGRGRERQ